MLSQKSSESGRGGISNQQVRARTSNQAFKRDLPPSWGVRGKHTTLRVEMDIKGLHLTSVSYI